MIRMTNGEMIQKVFDCQVCEPIPEDDIIHVIFPDKNDSAIGFDWSWWNMEYKEPTTKNDLGVDAISRADVLDSIAIMCSAEELDVDFTKLLLLQRTIKALPPATPQEPRKGHCKDCKWWKDSDGEYRRGCGAESKCPINTKTVYLGNGYCYKFEPQESRDEK